MTTLPPGTEHIRVPKPRYVRHASGASPCAGLGLVQRPRGTIRASSNSRESTTPANELWEEEADPHPASTAYARLQGAYRHQARTATARTGLLTRVQNSYSCDRRLTTSFLQWSSPPRT